jgi:MFS transporter, DHA2 family, multidrug resistance protein
MDHYRNGDDRHLDGRPRCEHRQCDAALHAWQPERIDIMPLVAFFASRFGRKRFLMFSVLLFTGGSIMCGMARGMTTMVFFRIIQGIGGGALMPVSQAILRETFAPEEQGIAMGIFGLGEVMRQATMISYN